MKRVFGIYKITSPSGRIYIGQSVNILERWKGYNRYGSPTQTLLHRSFMKYGIKSHSFEIVHELPKDCGKRVLSQYEQFYMDAYRDCRVTLLNICPSAESTAGRPVSAETRAKLSLTSKNRVTSPETAKKISDALKGRVKSEAEKLKLRAAASGHKRSEESKRKQSIAIRGKKRKPRCEDSKRRQSALMSGRKLSNEHKESISKSLAGRPGSPHSQETKMKLSEIAKKQKRVPCSEKQKMQISAANKGAIRTPEMRERIAATLRLYNLKKKQNAL